MSRSLLDSFGLDHVFRAKVRPLFLVLPETAVISYGVMYLTGGAELAVQVLVDMLVVIACALTLLGVYGKTVCQVTLPIAAFSDLPWEGQRLFLFLLGLSFAGLGICFGVGLGVLLHG